MVRRTVEKLAVVADEFRHADLAERLAGTGCRAAAGEDGLIEAAAGDSDLVIAAIVGCAGSGPFMAAIGAGKGSHSRTRRLWSPPGRS